MGMGVDALWRVFGGLGVGKGDGRGVWDAVRGVGLHLFNAVADVKYKVAEQSMGTMPKSAEKGERPWTAPT